MKAEYNNKKFKISTPTWNETFNLPGGSYSIDDIQYYFEFLMKKHVILNGNPSKRFIQTKLKIESFLK